MPIRSHPIQSNCDPIRFDPHPIRSHPIPQVAESPHRRASTVLGGVSPVNFLSSMFSGGQGNEVDKEESTPRRYFSPSSRHMAFGTEQGKVLLYQMNHYA